MKTLLKIFLILVLIGMVGKACDQPNSEVGSNEQGDDRARPSASTDIAPAEEYVLDAGSSSSCVNYLKGKTFTGGSVSLQFGYDGNVGAYDSNGRLVFGGTLEVGAIESAVSRWIYVRDMSGSGKLEFLLSADGKMMEPSSLVIYSPQ